MATIQSNSVALSQNWGAITFNDYTFAGKMVDFQDLMVAVAEKRAVAVEGEVTPMSVRMRTRNKFLDDLGNVLAELTKIEASFDGEDDGDLDMGGWMTDVTGDLLRYGLATPCTDYSSQSSRPEDRDERADFYKAGWVSDGSSYSANKKTIAGMIQKVKSKIEQRYTKRRGYCIIVVAEGAMPKGGSVTGSMSSEIGYQHIKLGGVGEQLAADLKVAGVEHDIRYTILGHLQRGGTPIAFDRVLATEFGVRAMEFVMEGHYGQMVAYHHPDIVGIPLEEAVRKQNLVAPDSRLVHTAKGVGIEFGD